jgi:2-polyprenyl-3-methyl-5-hydroxy-6-metoxy-1,4-benzoquinol methylase
VANRVKKLVNKSSARAIDIGCGNGQWLLTLPKEWELEGLELNPETAEIARRSTRAKIYSQPFEELSLAAQGYDLITAFALIEHLISPQEFVGWAARNLHSSGLLVLMTGDRASWCAKRMAARWPLYASPDHISYFSFQSLCHLLQQYNFEVIRAEWRYMYMPWKRQFRLVNLAMKALEVADLHTWPIHDHMYIYARLRASHSISPSQLNAK